MSEMFYCHGFTSASRSNTESCLPFLHQILFHVGSVNVVHRKLYIKNFMIYKGNNLTFVSDSLPSFLYVPEIFSC